MTNIPITTPPPPDIEAASRGLAAVLAADPGFDDALAAAEALSVLSDVISPYPALDYPNGNAVDGHGDVDQLLVAVLVHLDAAIKAARGVEEATRCAHAARVLRTHRTAGGTR